MSEIDINFIESMKSRLFSSRDFVRLDLDNHYFDTDFIKDCIENVEKCIINKHISPLEKLAILLLLDSADIDPTELIKEVAKQSSNKTINEMVNIL
jgi:hypothetical protein